MNPISLMLSIFGSLGLFLFGMKLLSEGLQKSAGQKMQIILQQMTGTHLKSVITGIVLTILVQSSSATTVMVVSFVNAGLLALNQAIGVILGANIGTTFTGWIVALIGFKLDISLLALTSLAIAVPFMFFHGSDDQDRSEIFLGFGILFLGLYFMQHSIPRMNGTEPIFALLEQYSTPTLLHTLMFVTVGALVTSIVQSSAATLTVVITMAYNGYIGPYSSAAIILGSNIGTTVTAFIASVGTSTGARRAAWAHILFNTFGSIFIIILFKPIIALVNLYTPGDIYTATGDDLTKILPIFLAVFNTTTNLMNTIILFPFINKYTRLIERLVKNKHTYKDESYHFTYTGTGFIKSTRPLFIAITGEVQKMGELTQDMLVKDIDRTGDSKWMKKKEEYADQMQEQLSTLCMKCIQDSSLTVSSKEWYAILRIIDELESITDSCMDMHDVSQRQTLYLDETAEMEKMILEYFDCIKNRLSGTLEQEQLLRALKKEKEIEQVEENLQRRIEKELEDKDTDLNQKLLVLEKIRFLDHITGYITNIAETLNGLKKHQPKLQNK